MFTFTGLAYTLNDKCGRDDAHMRSNEVFFFDTHVKRWISLEPAPTGKSRMGMVKVEDKIYMFGGNGNLLCLSCEAREDYQYPTSIDFAVVPAIREWVWPKGMGVLGMHKVYDDDIVLLDSTVSSSTTGNENVLNFPLELCKTDWLPCKLKLYGPGNMRVGINGSISCETSLQCSSVSFVNVNFACDQRIQRGNRVEGMLQASGKGASVEVVDSSISFCSSSEDGGSIRIRAGASLAFDRSILNDSHSSGQGGAVAVVGANASFSASSFINCTSTSGGGSVWAQHFEQYPEPPMTANLSFDSCLFESSASSASGGALKVQANTTARIQASHFYKCTAQLKGGAVMGLDGSEVVFINNTFAENSALGPGGGAVAISSSRATFSLNIMRSNSAPSGGGGVLLWDGTSVPAVNANESVEVPLTRHHHSVFLCGQGALAHGNNARYGPCVATGYKRLNLSGALSGYAGTMLRLSVYKLDEYDQTINIDSSSSVQAYTSLDSTWIRDESVDLLGQTIIPLHNGKAEWDMGFKPTFANVSAADDWTKIFRQPIFYVEGTDASTSGMMRSQKLSIHLSNAHDKVCPDGFVLSLDDAGAHRQGICSRSTCIVSIVLHLYVPGSHASINFLIDPTLKRFGAGASPANTVSIR